MVTLLYRDNPLPIPNMEIQRELETNIFNRENEVADFTIPFDIPLTDQVITLLGLIHLPATTLNTQEYPVELVMGPIRIASTLKLLEVSNETNTITCTLIGEYGTFASQIGKKRVTQLTLDGVRTVGTVSGTPIHYGSVPGYSFDIDYYPCDTHLHMHDVATGVVDTDYVFYSCVDKKANLDGIHKEDSVSIINGFYGISGVSYYMDPYMHYIHYMFYSLEWTNDRIFWVPQFKLWYVLRKCFEELGYTVNSSLATDDDFQKLVLHNTYSINRTSVVNTTISGTPTTIIKHLATEIDPRNHVPGMLIIDFFTEIGKLFNLQYKIDVAARIVTIRQLKTFLPTGNVVDLTQNVVGEPEVIYEAGYVPKGFNFHFASDPDNSLSGEMIKEDVHLFTYRGAYKTQYDLTSASIPGIAHNQMCYVKNVNQFWQYDGGGFVPYSHNLLPWKTLSIEDLQQVPCKAQPMPMYETPVRFQNNTGTDDGTILLAPTTGLGIYGRDLLSIIIEEGSAGNYLKIDTRSLRVPERDYIYLANWQGIQYHSLSILHWMPMASTTTYDASADGTTPKNPLSGLNLSWQAPVDDAVDSLHKDYVARVVTAKPFRYRLRLDYDKYSLIDFNETWLSIKDQLYLTRKGTLTYPLNANQILVLMRIQ